MTRKDIFTSVFDQMLGYSERDFKQKCASWGLEQYALLKEHKKILAGGNTSDNGVFIYGAAFAVIVGEFGHFAFNDHFLVEMGLPESEIELDLLGLDFRDIEGYVEEDMSEDRRDQLQRANIVNLQDIWSSVCEWQKDIYQSLTEIYKIKYQEKGETDPTLPDYAIFESLVAIFERKDEKDEGVVISPFSGHGAGAEMRAYEYVSSGFLY